MRTLERVGDAIGSTEEDIEAGELRNSAPGEADEVEAEASEDSKT